MGSQAAQRFAAEMDKVRETVNRHEEFRERFRDVFEMLAEETNAREDKS